MPCYQIESKKEKNRSNPQYLFPFGELAFVFSFSILGLMNDLQHFLWPDGKQFAVTFSYDDGQIQDEKLVGLLNQYGLKGTFHLNSGYLGTENFIRKENLASLYSGHEVACHSCHHPWMEKLPMEKVFSEFLEDRRELEDLTDSIVRGMSYPYGAYDSKSIEIIKKTGILYGRTVKSHEGFHLPDDWMEWHPTCHDKRLTENWIDRFFTLSRKLGPQLLYVWGHSFEFEQESQWGRFEKLLGSIAKQAESYWAATNLEIYRYTEAARNLEFSVNGKRLYNPSAHKVWLRVSEKIICIRSGEEMSL